MTEIVAYSLGLLAVAIYLLNVLDLYQTFLGLRLGAKETNPLLEDLNSKNEKSKLRATFFKHIFGIAIIVVTAAAVLLDIGLSSLLVVLSVFVVVFSVVVVSNQIALEYAIYRKLRSKSKKRR